MAKQTWKKRGLGPDRIREVVRTSRTLTQAARALGVNRATLHRWLEADPKLKAPREAKQRAVTEATEAAAVLGPDEWMQAIEKAYELTDTERVLLDLARQALVLAQDSMARPSERIGAMGRFQALVKDLDLEKPANGQTQAPRLYAVG